MVVSAVFALHVLEEAPKFTAWVNRHASDLYTQDDVARNNGAALVLAIDTTFLVSRVPNRPIVFLYYSTVLTQQALFNTAVPRRYHGSLSGPLTGILTGLVLFLPLWYYLTHLALGEGLLTRKSVVATAVIAAVIHTVVVAQQVFFVELP